MKLDLKRENSNGMPVAYNPIEYPAICVYKALPDGLKVGGKISGTFKGKVIKSVRSNSESSFDIELQVLDIENKKFEDMNDNEQREVMKDSFYKKIKE